MKKIIIIFLVLFVSSFSKEKVIFVTGDYFPYTSRSKVNKGSLIEILEEVGKRLDLDLVINFYPWKRCEELVKNGEAFATLPYIITEERSKIFDFSVSLIESEGKLFYMKDKLKNPTWTDYNSLNKYTIGGTLGYWYESVFRLNGLEADYSPTDEIALKKLYMGRIEILAQDDVVGWALIKKFYPQEVDKFDTMKKSLNQNSLHLMVSRKYPNANSLKHRINLSIEEMKKDGTFDKIIAKYIKKVN